MTIEQIVPSGQRELSGDAFVGRRVVMLLWDQHKTQTDLARRMGIAQSALSRKLRGERGWSVDDLRDTAIALGTSIAYLTGEVESPVVPHEGFEPSAFCSVGRRFPALRRGPTVNRPVVSLADVLALRAAKRRPYAWRADLTPSTAGSVHFLNPQPRV